MPHVSETWPMKRENKIALQRVEMRMIRLTCGVRLKVKLSCGIKVQVRNRGHSHCSAAKWHRHVLWKNDKKNCKNAQLL